MTPDPTCPRCNGQFVEVIEEGTTFDEDDDDEANNPFAAVHGDPFPGFSFRTGPTRSEGMAAPPLSFVQGSGGGLPGGLGGLLAALASGGVRGPQSPSSPSAQRGTDQQSGSGQPGGASGSGCARNTRSGSTSFGPFGVQWNVQYGSGGGDPYQRATQHQAEQNSRQQQDLRSPPTLSNFLRFAFGPTRITILTLEMARPTFTTMGWAEQVEQPMDGISTTTIEEHIISHRNHPTATTGQVVNVEPTLIYHQSFLRCAICSRACLGIRVDKVDRYWTFSHLEHTGQVVDQEDNGETMCSASKVLMISSVSLWNRRRDPTHHHRRRKM